MQAADSFNYDSFSLKPVNLTEKDTAGSEEVAKLPRNKKTTHIYTGHKCVDKTSIQRKYILFYSM